jgi:hypothetical protein
MATALIQERGTVSGNQFRMQRINEDAGQTFLAGTPTQLNNVTGALKAWDGVTITNGVAGISKEFGANLTTAGLAQQQAMPGGAGAVQNEPAAVTISRPYFNDGKTGIVLAIPDNVFYGQVGPTQTVAQTDIGKQYGLTKDVDGHWFVDKTKTGVNAVVVITGFDAWDTLRGVLFSFLPAVGQIQA